MPLLSRPIPPYPALRRCLIPSYPALRRCLIPPYPALVACLVSCSDPQSTALLVTTNSDSGTASLRLAVKRANADVRITSIEFKSGLEPIAIRATITYTGTQALQLDGKGAVIDASQADSTAFAATGGGNLTIENLTIRNSPADGVMVQVPADAQGTLEVTLRNVVLADNKGHGLLVNDQVTPDVMAGVPPDSSGSAAGLKVELINSQFLRNGYSVSDRDGIRINDGAGGNLVFIARGVRTEENAGDGIELDERGTGDVQVDVHDFTITGNGKFDPADLDDGFDIDELDDGSIVGTFEQLVATGNHEDGVDFTETGPGDITVEIRESQSSGNRGRGILADQELPGVGSLLLERVELEGNGRGATAGRNVIVTTR